MSSMRVIITGLFLAAVGATWLGSVQLFEYQSEITHNLPTSRDTSESRAILVEARPLTPEPLPVTLAPVALPALVLIPDVPFTTQAPFAEWSNQLFQDGCEEAALIMADAWVQKKTLTPEGVQKEIVALSAFEQKKFGQAVDTSIVDTGVLLSSYFGVTSAVVHTGVTLEDIKRALADHQIVIVPTDGRKLQNPHFKQPGPPRHMLVIIGYNNETGEFIVNDPGTRKGQGYRYSQTVLFDALLDYATGKHIPVASADKVMLTVSRY